jgi:hypothetical protein
VKRRRTVWKQPKLISDSTAVFSFPLPGERGFFVLHISALAAFFFSLAPALRGEGWGEGILSRRTPY